MRATTIINEKPLQGEIKDRVEDSQNTPVESTETDYISEFSSSCGMMNLSMRQRGIIGSCFGEDFLL